MLAGRRVLVTGRTTKGRGVAGALADLGARVVEVPAVEVAFLEETAGLDAALGALASGDWVAFTSVPGVEAVARRLRAGTPMSAHVKIAVVGPGTAAAVAEQLPARTADVAPVMDWGRDSLADALAAIELRGRRVLLPLSSQAPPTLAARLLAQGAEVLAVVAYGTRMPEDAAARLRGALPEIEIATFASSSAVENYVAATGEAGRRVAAIAIGPGTAATAERLGLRVAAVAWEPSPAGLAAAVVAHVTGSAPPRPGSK